MKGIYLFIISYTDLATKATQYFYCNNQGNPTRERDKNLVCCFAASVLTG
jgi:hypothetical protein